MRNRIVKCGMVVAASAAVLGGGVAFAQQDHPRPAVHQGEKTISLGLQADWSNDADFGLGGRVIVNLDRFAKGLEAVGSFDYFFPSDSGLEGVDLKYFEINANAVYKFELTSSSLRPYVGAGLNIAHAKGGVDLGDVDISASDTKVGLNFLGGVLFAKRFFVEAKFEAGGGETFVASGGIRF